jgi:hypothetical protein
MTTKIIIQDDDKFGLYSTISDTIYAIDCTKEEIIKIWKESAAQQAEKEMERRLESNRGKMTLEEALNNHIFHYEDLDGFDLFIKKLIEENTRKF